MKQFFIQFLALWFCVFVFTLALLPGPWLAQFALSYVLTHGVHLIGDIAFDVVKYFRRVS